MSLLNQLLLDLDRREALTANLPAAARGIAGAPLSRLPLLPRLTGLTRLRQGTLLAAATGIGLAAMVAIAGSPTHATVGAASSVGTLAAAPVAMPDAALGATPGALPQPGVQVQRSMRDASGAIGQGLGLDPSGSTPGGDGALSSAATIVPLPAIRLVDTDPVPAANPAEPVAAPSARVVGRLPYAGRALPAVAAAGVEPAAGEDLPRMAAPERLARPILRPPAAGVNTFSATPAAPAPFVEPRVEKLARQIPARERAEAEYQRALGLHQQGQDADAEAGFTAALREDGTHTAARQALAVALIGEGRLADAQARLADGLQLNPQDTQLAGVLARVKAEQQDLPGAIAVLQAALPTGTPVAGRPEAPESRALLATLQQRAGNNAEAIEHYSRALRQAPNNGAWWIGLANSYVAESRPDAARDAYEHARATKGLAPELDQYAETEVAGVWALKVGPPGMGVLPFPC